MLFAPPLLLGLALAPCLPSQEPAREDPFPPSTAIAQGVSPEALAALDALVAGFVADDEVVGAELHVIVGGRTVLHTAHGWRDRDEGRAMETDSVFCVRSMTKPLIGTAVLMLAQEGRIDLRAPVATYLPALEGEATRAITVEQLLQHTSGFPMSLIGGANLSSLGGLDDLVALGAERGPDFEPGSAFQYSDHGTDTLTAVVGAVSGLPAEAFVRTRLLDPLGMADSTTLLAEHDPLRARAASKYIGTAGAWSRYWSPADPSLFPIFLGSQGLYSTTTDYARFLDLWLARGRAGGERLLEPLWLRRALRPGPHPLPPGGGLPGLRRAYGYLMQLWTRDDEDGDPETAVYGHSGSDGTHAWVFPEQRALVLYFTQSRGTPTGLRLEEQLGELFLGVPYDPNQAAPPLAEYLGYYREEQQDLYRAVVRDGDDLALEVLGKAIVPLDYAGEDRWKMRLDPGIALQFHRDDAGDVFGYSIGEQNHEFRFVPSEALPTGEAVAAEVLAAHGLAALEQHGTLRQSGRVSIETLGIEAEYTAVYGWPDRFRVESWTDDQFERVAFDGETVRAQTSLRPLEVLEGLRARSARANQLLARFGDWERWFDDLRVIQRLEDGDGAAWIVRDGDLSAPGTTLYVRAGTGLVGRMDSFTVMDGVGRTGQSVEFGDFRDVGGMWLPFRLEITFPNPMLGTLVLTVESTELGVDLPDGTFELSGD